MILHLQTLQEGQSSPRIVAEHHSGFPPHRVTKKHQKKCAAKCNAAVMSGCGRVGWFQFGTLVLTSNVPKLVGNGMKQIGPSGGLDCHPNIVDF